LRNYLQVNSYATDYWRSYEDFIPPEKHIQSKEETYTVESYNSRVGVLVSTYCYTFLKTGLDIILQLFFISLSIISEHKIKLM